LEIEVFEVFGGEVGHLGVGEDLDPDDVMSVRGDGPAAEIAKGAVGHRMGILAKAWFYIPRAGWGEVEFEVKEARCRCSVRRLRDRKTDT